MDFIFSKLLGAATSPGHFLLMLTVVGGIMCRRRWGRIALFAGLTSFVAIAVTPVSVWMLLPLEQRFPSEMQENMPPLDGIIVLGGAIMPAGSAEHGSPQLTRDGERLTVLPGLMRRYPGVPVIFTGGSGDPRRPDDKEGPIALQLLTDWGVDTSRVIIEDQSRTTWENAVNSRPLIAGKGGGHWLLVTSASHMPRSMGVFRVAIPDVRFTAYPVGYNANHADAGRFGLNLSDNLERVEAAAYEWRGLIAYWLAGRTDALFPSP